MEKGRLLASVPGLYRAVYISTYEGKRWKRERASEKEEESSGGVGRRGEE